MNKLVNLFCKNKKNAQWEGTIRLSFEMKESVYLLELLIKKDEKIVVYDLNELNCLFEAKYKKAYTVAQYQTMSKILMIMDGVSTSNIYLFSGCEYKNGKIGFEKGAYFKLCSCLIESKRILREKKGKEKQKNLYNSKKNISPVIQKNVIEKTIIQKTNTAPVSETKSDYPSMQAIAEKNDVQLIENKQISDTGGITKEDFKKQIQARRYK